MRIRRFFIIVILILGIGYYIFNPYFFKAVYSACKSYVSKPNIEYINNNYWVYHEGFLIKGDYLVFDEDRYSISGDTIIYKGEPKAKIVLTNEYLEHIKIKSLKNGSIGVYYKKTY